MKIRAPLIRKNCDGRARLISKAVEAGTTLMVGSIVQKIAENQPDAAGGRAVRGHLQITACTGLFSELGSAAPAVNIPGAGGR